MFVIKMSMMNGLLRLLVFISLLPFFATAQSLSCDCKPVTDCPMYSYLLLNHAPHENDYVLNQIRDAGCGFRRLEPLVCCPNKRYHSRTIQPRFYSTEYMPYNSIESTTREPWIWDVKPLPSYEDSNDNEVPTTTEQDSHINFPYVFYEPTNSESFHHPPKFGVEQNFQHSASPAWQNSLHGPESKRRMHIFDAPIVYPDDKRLNRPITFPMPPKRQAKVTTTLPPNIAEASPARIAQINAPNCGISISTRIFGGEDSIPGQFPWIARIAYLNKTSNRISYRCSASVITQYHILTAAHCVTNLQGDLELSHVRIGDLDIRVPKKCRRNKKFCKTSHTLLISDILVHPNYDRPKLSNDIALLRIEMPENITFNYTICMPLNNSETFSNRLVGSTGIVAGWSTNDDGTETVNSTIKFLRLPIVNTTECAVTYAKYSENFREPIEIESTQLCAQGQPKNDVCRGDSGGPFMDDGTTGLINSDGRFSLLGIVAFGPTTCGLLNFPGVYTRVSAYIDWIVNSIR